MLNWGESTFIPNGINAINPFDVSKLRLPGSELREALLPVWMASADIAATDTLSVAGFYQLVWEETHIDPVGSYFSVTDYAGPGARKAVISDLTAGRDDGHGFGPLAGAAIDRAPLPHWDGSNPAAVALGATAPISSDRDFAGVLRGSDAAPRDSGQWGLAVRYLAEDLNQTEFGFYFINYHSRLPTVGARTAGANSIQAGLAAAGAGGGRGALEARCPVTPDLQPPANPAVAVDRYGKGGHYFLEYAEDIQLFGLSFNTVAGSSGWALQGEYSLRPNAPLQRAERTVLDGRSHSDVHRARSARSGRPPSSRLSAPTSPPIEPSKVEGYVEREVSQVQATATQGVRTHGGRGRASSSSGKRR